jgi:hypothetical protein
LDLALIRIPTVERRGEIVDGHRLVADVRE